MPKITLDQSWIYAGKHYGPGEVDITDEAAYTAIKGKIDAAAKAAREAEGETEAEEETARANVVAEQADADRRAAEKKR